MLCPNTVLITGGNRGIGLARIGETLPQASVATYHHFRNMSISRKCQGEFKGEFVFLTAFTLSTGVVLKCYVTNLTY